ncbi:hypothetical protein ACNR9Q_00325 [Maribacter sp. X9]|uniref:hypothetical protein n=1 Tax=Maribacter sp. X9 TaxID=3402159 RepID=UPI003AF3EDC1
MIFLLIGGQQNTGKSETMARLFIVLSSRYSSVINVHPFTSPPPTNPFEDFSAILQGVDVNGKQVNILIHSPTDDMDNINLLRTNIAANKPDVVICSIRDINWQRQSVLEIIDKHFHLEIPLARITRRGANSGNPNSNFQQALNWYQNTIDRLINRTLSQNPFDLI